MAVTVTTTNNIGKFPQNWVPSPAGGPALQVWVGNCTGDASYPTGGYPVVAALFGMTQVLAIIPATASNSNLVANVAGKLKFFVATTGAEVANTTDLSAVNFECIVVGL